MVDEHASSTMVLAKGKNQHKTDDFCRLSKKSGGSKAPSASDVAVRKALLRIRE
jgi:hypothetical protein